MSKWLVFKPKLERKLALNQTNLGIVLKAKFGMTHKARLGDPLGKIGMTL